MGFQVYRVALGQTVLRLLPFYPASITPALLLTHFFIEYYHHVTLGIDRILKYKHNSGRAVGKQYLYDISRRDSKLVDYVEGDAQQGRRRQDPSHHDGPSRISVLSL